MAKGAAFRPSYNANRRPSSAQSYKPRRSHSIAVPNEDYQRRERRGSAWTYATEAPGHHTLDETNDHIEEEQAREKLLYHGLGLWAAQGTFGVVVLVVAAISDLRYGHTKFYKTPAAGAKLLNIQYTWAVLNLVAMLIGIRAYMVWSDQTSNNASMRDNAQASKLQICLGFISWSVGIWMTAVVFISFKDFTFRENIYPIRLGVLFLTTAVMCILSDLWCFGKLLSLCMYVSGIAEKRINQNAMDWKRPNRSTITDKGYQGNGLSKQFRAQKDLELGRRASAPTTRYTGRQSSLEGRGRRERRGSGSVYADSAISAKAAGSKPNFRYDVCNMKPSTVAVLSPISSESSIDLASMLSEPSAPPVMDGTLLLHEFQLLWAKLPKQGSFSTTTHKTPSHPEITNHLSEQGFQVVHCGNIGRGNIEIKFCALSYDDLSGYGDKANNKVWFLCTLTILHEIQEEDNQPRLKLNAEFKCKDSSLIPTYVSKFHFHLIFGDG